CPIIEFSNSRARDSWPCIGSTIIIALALCEESMYHVNFMHAGFSTSRSRAERTSYDETSLTKDLRFSFTERPKNAEKL
uniref:Uncharacterized protein n=1 Tax=Romanomermis culicivorax TaxID=13658 RepID=A0A915I8E6_ROMCU